MNDLVDILIEADRWGTRTLLERCVELPDADFRRPFEIGPGSLHDTAAHLVRAARFFTALLDGTAPPPRPGTEPRSATAVLEAYDAASAALRSAVERSRSRPVDERIAFPAGPDGTPPSTVSRPELLAQIGTHGAYHRAQLANMLRRLGIDPVPQTDVILWALSGHGQRAGTT